MEGLVRCSANDVPLSPISFLERAAVAFADSLSVVYGYVRYTWSETYERCTKLASALANFGLSEGDVVAALIPNIPEMYELHFAVPMVGAVLCALNIRLDSAMISALLQHSKAKFFFVDYQYYDIVLEALNTLSKTSSNLPQIILVLDEQSFPVRNVKIPSKTLQYDHLIKTAKPDFEIRKPKDEWDPIALNYTSGTTSMPKGVIYTHRGAYLNSLATILSNEMHSNPVYLWTLPMFHTNGWCFTWGIAAQGGTNVCLRNVTAKGIFNSIVEHKVTNFSGAPTVLNIIINASASEIKPLPNKVLAMTGGAAPPPQVINKMEELGFSVTHGYGLTETYGPATFCVWKREWDDLSAGERAKIKARQGIHHVGLSEVDVKDSITMRSVPADGTTMGEVMLKGNTIMHGYLRNLKATEESFKDGWFHTGDLGVKHCDGYIELKDRIKDIIVSGGEIISTIEVEAVIFAHPAVLETAVVGRPDEHWGETPCAFVKLKEGYDHVTAVDIIKFCRDHLPHFMSPRTVVFEDDLPKTSTGKVQKSVLKDKAKAMGSLSKRKSKL